MLLVLSLVLLACGVFFCCMGCSLSPSLSSVLLDWYWVLELSVLLVQVLSLPLLSLSPLVDRLLVPSCSLPLLLLLLVLCFVLPSLLLWLLGTDMAITVPDSH